MWGEREHGDGEGDRRGERYEDAANSERERDGEIMNGRGY